MRFDPGKAWPHPVLRPPTYGDDYPHADFEVEIEVKRSEGSTSITVNAEFSLSDPELLRLIRDGAAEYTLLIKASRTHFREMLSFTTPQIEKTFSGGDLSGKVEFAPFLVATKPIRNFHAEGWHDDFAGRSFDISAGCVLAEDVPKDYWVDTADEAPLGSIFGHKSRPDIPDGRWDFELAKNHVWILMSPADNELYRVAREQANNRPDSQYLMNGLYLPVLIAVLNEVDLTPDAYSEYRWFTSLDQRLHALGCKEIGNSNANRWEDAQRILDMPFAKMPIFAEAGSDST